MKPLHCVLSLAVFCWTMTEGITQEHTTSQVTRVATQDVKPLEVDGIELKAPQTCEVGELVRFDARGSKVDSLVWRILPASDDFEVTDDKRRAFFSARSGGEYLLIVAGARDGQAFLEHHTLTVKGVAPLTGLKAKVGNWLKLLPEISDRNEKLASMATVFRKLAEQPVEADKMVEATALANSAVLGDSVTQWIPFLDKLGNELDKLVDDGKLDTVEQYKATWGEIANALDYHSKK